MVKQYTEDISVSEPVRARYVEGIDRLVARMREEANKRRREFVTPEKMAADREYFRSEYVKMLGIDVLRDVLGTGIPECDFSFVGEDELCEIQRMIIKIGEGIVFTGLLLTPHKREEKAPLVIMSHGGGGSPELCCDMIGHNNYGGVVRKLLGEGCIVFAHQLLNWNLSAARCEVSKISAYTTKYNRAESDNALKQCGTSISAFEIYSISRVIDLLLSRDDIDEQKCGMLGLSYGGFYTMYTMAYDTRIKVGWSAAIFNDRIKYCWTDMVWMGSATKLLDAEVAGLCAPRRFICDVGEDDTVFTSDTAEKLFPETKAYFAASGVPENVTLNLWNGGHRFDIKSFNKFVEELL